MVIRAIFEGKMLIVTNCTESTLTTPFTVSRLHLGASAVTRLNDPGFGVRSEWGLEGMDPGGPSVITIPHSGEEGEACRVS